MSVVISACVVIQILVERFSKGAGGAVDGSPSKREPDCGHGRLLAGSAPPAVGRMQGSINSRKRAWARDSRVLEKLSVMPNKAAISMWP
jgi:hypothetical protein